MNAQSLDEHQGIALSEVFERLEELDSDGAAPRAAVILSGLGFDPQMQNTPTREFSGGWRMRIALAQVASINPSHKAPHIDNATDAVGSVRPINLRHLTLITLLMRWVP
jgi:ABC-type microcin C transport system duplicated ATPase subunit YejF